MQTEETRAGTASVGAGSARATAWGVRARSPKETACLVVPLILALVGALVLFVLAFPLTERLSLGPEFGVSIEASLDAQPLGDDDSLQNDDLASAAKVVQARMVAYGVSDAVVTPREGGLTARLHAIGDVQRLVDVTTRTGKFELVEVDRISDAEAIAKIRSTGAGTILTPGSYVALMTNADLASVTATNQESDDGSSSTHALNFVFAGEGRQAFAEVTSKLSRSGGLLAFVVDGVVVAVSSVSTVLLDGQVSVSGGFSETEAARLAAILTGGELPVSLTSAGSSQMPPSLGQAALPVAAVLFVLAIAAVLATLFRRFRAYVLVVAAGVAVWLLLVVGGLAQLCQRLPFYLDLPALCGLCVGMASYLLWAHAVLRALARLVDEGGEPSVASLEATRHTCDVSAVCFALSLLLALFALALAWPAPVVHGLVGLALSLLASLLVQLCVAVPLIRLASLTGGTGAWDLRARPSAGAIQETKSAVAKRAGKPSGSAGHKPPKQSGVTLIKAAKARKAKQEAQGGGQSDE